ncbi:MAG TPA: TfoX/Sxy family protein [Candidatus Saccharimonadia bacterium]
MPTSANTIELLLEQLSTLSARLGTRKMFGEYCLYVDGKPTAFICDDKMFLKITPVSRGYLDESHDGPAYPGSKPYICIPPDMWEARDWLAEVVGATADSLPAPKPKRRK